MTWKTAALRDAYEYNREDTPYGYGNESNWQRERPDLTYEDYWIFVCLVGHVDYHKYLDAHFNDYEHINQLIRG